jgi:BON domain
MRNRSQLALKGGAVGFGLGIGLGVATMYLFDAESGRRRRALVRDRAARTVRRAGRGLNAGARDLSQRARGLGAAVRKRLRPDREVPDSILQERVRAALGHATGHPAAIEVEASGGHVLLSGPVLARDANRVLRRVRRVPGVRSVANRLERLERFEPLAAVEPNGDEATAGHRRGGKPA